MKICTGKKVLVLPPLLLSVHPACTAIVKQSERPKSTCQPLKPLRGWEIQTQGDWEGRVSVTRSPRQFGPQKKPSFPRLFLATGVNAFPTWEIPAWIPPARRPHLESHRAGGGGKAPPRPPSLPVQGGRQRRRRRAARTCPGWRRCCTGAGGPWRRRGRPLWWTAGPGCARCVPRW